MLLAKVFADKINKVSSRNQGLIEEREFALLGLIRPINLN